MKPERDAVSCGSNRLLWLTKFKQLPRVTNEVLLRSPSGSGNMKGFVSTIL